MGNFLKCVTICYETCNGIIQQKQEQRECDEMNDWTIVHLPLYLSLKVTLSCIIVLIYNDCVCL